MVSKKASITSGKSRTLSIIEDLSLCKKKTTMYIQPLLQWKFFLLYYDYSSCRLKLFSTCTIPHLSIYWSLYFIQNYIAIPMVFDQARGLVIMDTITLLFVHCKNVWSPVKMVKARPEILSKLQQSLIEIRSPWLACMLDVPFSVNIKRNTFGNGTDARFKDWFTKFLITTAICVAKATIFPGLDPCKILIFKKLTFFIEILLFFFISLSRFPKKSSSKKIFWKNASFEVFVSGNETSGTELSGSWNSEKWACYNLDIVESCPLVPKSPESVQKRRRSCVTMKKPFHFYIIEDVFYKGTQKIKYQYVFWRKTC